MNYFNCVEVGKLKYSVDMIRFKFELDPFLQDKLYLIIKQISTYDYFSSNKSFQYKELFKINTSDFNSFSLGVGFNGIKSKQRKLCFIEFNPNKLYDSIELKRILSFLNNHVNLDLALFDIAIDIPYKKKFVSLIKDKRVHKKFSYDCEGDNITEYLGQSADAGRIKLYNKTIESELDYDLTRLELTTTCTDFLVVQKQIPNLFICGDLDLLSTIKLSKSDFVLLQLLWLSSDPGFYFKQLGRDKQVKLKPFISSNFSLGFTEEVFNSLLKNIIFFKNKSNFR